MRIRPSHLPCAIATAGLLMACSPAAAQTLTLPFYEGFEPTSGHPEDCSQSDRGNWSWDKEWIACETPFNLNCPQDTYPNPSSKGWGPVKFESYPDLCAGGHVFAGYRAGRQPVADPYWYSLYHDFTPPQGVGDLHAEAMQYDPANVICTCECNCDPDGARFGYPNGRPNYQVQGWLMLTDPGRNEYYIVGINSYNSWTRLSWATKSDGWHATEIPRQQGWRKLGIIVHPYSGAAGDVEFRIDGATVATGHRVQGGEVSRVRLGGDPGMITENHLTNTFEELWYDEVKVFFAPVPCHAPRMDIDGDGDVDQDDFGVFQECFSGTQEMHDPVRCICFDAVHDGRIDTEDVEVFARCASGPSVLADKNCDP